MSRLSKRARPAPVRRQIGKDYSPALAYSLPYASIMLCSILPIMALANTMPFWPPMGFLFFLAWRIYRPGLLPIWAGFPLGAFDDLFSGQPFGSGILLWSMALIMIEYVEARFPWRGFWQDWTTAAIVAVSYILLAMLASGTWPNQHILLVSMPQLLLSVLLYPIIVRMVAGLDRLRLKRFVAVA